MPFGCGCELVMVDGHNTTQAMTLTKIRRVDHHRRILSLTKPLEMKNMRGSITKFLYWVFVGLIDSDGKRKFIRNTLVGEKHILPIMRCCSLSLSLQSAPPPRKKQMASHLFRKGWEWHIYFPCLDGNSTYTQRLAKINNK